MIAPASPGYEATVREALLELFVQAEDRPRVRTRVLDALAEHCNRFGVGDEKQSIYSFQGAAPEMFAATGAMPRTGAFGEQPR